MSDTYPKAMVHPQSRKSVIRVNETQDAIGRTVKDYHGTADRFPPVTVMNETQEMVHRAMGYLESNEKPSASAYVEFPMYLRHPAKPSMLVNDQDELFAAEKEGYEMPGTPSAEAFERTHASPYVPGRVTQEWPKMVNGVEVDPNAPQAGPIQYPKWVGGPKGKSVNNAAEEAAFLGVPSIEVAPAPAVAPSTGIIVPKKRGRKPKTRAAEAA